MATLKSTIELYDNFSAPMMNIISTANAGAAAVENVETAMSQSINGNGFTAVEQGASRAEAAVNSLSEAVAAMSAPSFTVNADGQLSFDIPEQMTIDIDASVNSQKIVELQERLQGVSRMQTAIDTAAKNLAVVSPDTSKEITSVNREIEQASAALEFLQKNPFNLDAEAAKLQIESLTSAIDAAKARQAELNTELGNMPTQIAASMEIAVVADVPDPLVENPAPVSVPIEWQTDGLEVFTGTGIERFQQEIQSANNMLNTLNATQSKIVQTAAKTDLFPESAVADITSVQSRLTALQQKIQQIESNPINIGSDTANAGMERLRGQLSQALAAQQALNTAAASMDISAANEAYLQLLRTLGSTEQYIRDNTSAQGQFNSAIEQGTSKADGLMGAIKGAVAAYATIQTAKNVIELSNTMTSTETRLSLLVDDGGSVDELENKIYAAAQNARGSFSDMADIVARFGNNAGDAFSGTDEVVAFAEQVQKQMTIAGASTSESSNAMLQLSQALASGVLRGDELNSIFEQAPNLIQSIADYMDVDLGQIRDMASEGQITADIVKNAVFAAAEGTNSKFESMPMTFSQIWTSFKNTALMAFKPVLARINELANSEAFQSFVNGATNALATLAGAVANVFDYMIQAGNFIADNWSRISPIIAGVVGIMGTYYGAQVALNTVSVISKSIHFAQATAAALHAMTTKTLTAALSKQIAVQYGLNAAMFSCPITWIIVIIGAVIAAIYGVVAAINAVTGETYSATGIIFGIVAELAAGIVNVVIGLVNGIIQLLRTTFVEPFIGIVEWILNVANGGFDSFGDAVKNLLGNIISWFLSLGKVVTKIIDAIFGTDWTAGLTSLQDSVLQWGKNENAITLSREAPTINTRMEYGRTWDAAYGAGKNLGGKVKDGLGDIADTLAVSLPNAEDYAIDASGFGGVGSDVAGIADDTDAMRESMELSTDELELLRDIAERDTVNKFTTAELHIDMTGMTNKIESDIDLDGLVSSFVQKLGEELAVTAEGVHI